MFIVIRGDCLSNGDCRAVIFRSSPLGEQAQVGLGRTSTIFGKVQGGCHLFRDFAVVFVVAEFFNSAAVFVLVDYLASVIFIL